MSVGESLPYRSPLSKLLRFFLRSRDKWKARCKEAKRENKSLKYRLTVMTESRNRWKADARLLKKNARAETTIAAEETLKNDTPRRRPRPARLGVGASR